MTDTQALRDLLVKVEAGDDFTGDALNRAVDAMKSCAPSMQTYEFAVRFRDAQRGSLDAAKALHEAVLPGWMGSFTTDGFARVAKGGRVLTVMECHHLDNSPARAWLICLLRALIAQATP